MKLSYRAAVFILGFFVPIVCYAVQPTEANRFFIVNPGNGTVGVPVTVTIEARRGATVDTNYQHDVTLLTTGSATGGGLVDIVNGVGTIVINDQVPETVTLFLSDTQSTGLDVSSTQTVTFAASGGGGGAQTPAWNQQKFWFRDDDGGEVTATGFGVENVAQNTNIVNVLPGAAFRLRFVVKLTTANGSIAPQLEFKEGTGCTTGTWNAVVSGAHNIQLRLSDNIIDSASTTQQLTAGPNFIAGKIFESTNPGPSLSVLKNQSTEYEWSLQTAPAIPFGTTYSFRITNNGSSLNTYDQCPALTIQAAPPPPPPPSPPPPPPISLPGAGGGGLQATEVIFSGKVFPGAKLFIIGKDISTYPTPAEKIMSQDVVVSESGDFRTNVFAVSPINQKSFGLLIKDEEGRTTQTKFFNLNPFENSLIVKDVLFPPTVGFLSRLVARGTPLVVRGYAVPGSTVSLEIDDIIERKVTASQDGSYKVELATGEFDFGLHHVRAKQIISYQKQESDFSTTDVVMISHIALPKADLSGDGNVDIKDWSIFLSRWSSHDPQQKKTIDFNGDGKVDISDFGIFIKQIRKR